MSDSFLETNVPLMLLIEAAEAGNEKEVNECAVVFTEHAAKLEEVNIPCGPCLVSRVYRCDYTSKICNIFYDSAKADC